MGVLTMTRKELASISGYTYRRLYDIDRALPEEKKLFVIAEDGKCDLGLFVQRWVSYNIDHEMSDIDDLEVIKAKHEKVKTEKTELEVARMRGQVIDVQDVRRLWGEIANTVMQNMIHLPTKLAPMLQMMDNVDEIAGIIDSEVRTVLTAIADTPLPSYVEGDSEKEEDED